MKLMVVGGGGREHAIIKKLKESEKVEKIYAEIPTDPIYNSATELSKKLDPENQKYITIVPTDVKDNSCTLFMRPVKPASYEGITLRSWYNSQNLEIPEYLDAILDTNLDEYFMEVYVFRGEFTKAIKEGLKDTMYCKHCGKEVDVDSKFCKHCGGNLE